jgi:hypothetical protein
MITGRHNPEDHNPHFYHRENLKSHTKILFMYTAYNVKWQKMLVQNRLQIIIIININQFPKIPSCVASILHAGCNFEKKKLTKATLHLQNPQTTATVPPFIYKSSFSKLKFVRKTSLLCSKAEMGKIQPEKNIKSGLRDDQILLLLLLLEVVAVVVIEIVIGLGSIIIIIIINNAFI